MIILFKQINIKEKEFEMKKIWIAITCIILIISMSPMTFAQKESEIKANNHAKLLNSAVSKTADKAPTKITAEMKIYNALNEVKTKLILNAQEFKGKDLSKLIAKIAEDDKFFYYGGYSYTIMNNKATIEFIYTETKEDIRRLQSPSETTVEMKVYNALNEVQKTLTLHTQEFKGKDISDIVNKIAENDKFFYYKGYEFRFVGNKLTIEFIYTEGEDILVQKQALDQAVQSIIKKTIKPNMTEYQKVKVLHDYVVLNTTYDYDNYLKDTIPDNSYNAYGVLVKRKAVCQGYAEALNILYHECGIDSQVVSGDMNDGGGHAWNIVRVEGKYYHLDATHDDPVPNVEGQVLYDYFLVKDDFMKKSRNWDFSKYPICNSRTYN